MAVRKAKRAASSKSREGKLFAALCREHGYMFMDSLPSSQRSGMVMHGGDLVPYVTVKLAVPADSVFGEKIRELRVAKKAARP